jgi:hypothetical protein
VDPALAARSPVDLASAVSDRAVSDPVGLWLVAVVPWVSPVPVSSVRAKPGAVSLVPVSRVPGRRSRSSPGAARRALALPRS